MYNKRNSTFFTVLKDSAADNRIYKNKENNKKKLTKRKHKLRDWKTNW